jgi:hypothetical protein
VVYCVPSQSGPELETDSADHKYVLDAG